MTALTIEGIYKDCRVGLATTPEGVREARVVVTFLSERLHRKNMRPMQYGQFPDGEQSTEEAFHLAESRGDADLTNED